MERAERQERLPRHHVAQNGIPDHQQGEDLQPRRLMTRASSSPSSRRTSRTPASRPVGTARRNTDGPLPQETGLLRHRRGGPPVLSHRIPRRAPGRPARGLSELYRPGTPYRQTGVILAGLVPEDAIQHDLFDDVGEIEKMTRIYQAVDALSGEVRQARGSSTPPACPRSASPARRGAGRCTGEAVLLFRGENARQRLRLPMLHIKV